MKKQYLYLGVLACMSYAPLDALAQDIYASVDAPMLDLLTPKGSMLDRPSTSLDAMSPRGVRNHWTKLANTAYEAGDYDQARDLYAKAVAAETDAELLVILGMLDYQRGFVTESLANFDAAIRFQPDYAPAYFHKADVLMDLEFFSSAITVYDRALAYESEDFLALNNRGLAYLNDGKANKAWKDFETAYELATTKIELSEVLMNMAHCQLALENLDIAYHCAVGAIYADDNRPAAFHTLGIVEAAKGHHTPAVASYDIALDMDPSSIAIYEGLAKSYIALEDVQKASSTIHRISNLDAHYEGTELLWLEVDHLRSNR